MAQMFQSCSSLVTVPLFNTAAVTTMAAMFRYCSNLQSLPLFNTAANTNIATTFQDCFSLREIPAFNTAAVTQIATAFSGSGIRTIPAFNFSAVTGVNSNVFERCFSLVSVPNISLSGVTDFVNMFATCHSLASVGFTGMRYSISFTACNLSKEALETIFTNLGTAQAGATRTLTLTNNWGAPTPVSLTGTPTAGSTTITMANTTGLATGMQVTGINTSLTTGRAVTFTDAGDLVNLTAHGLSNGDEVSFSVITTTTGIVINTIYFVVNATADNFQLASTLGGSALPLTTNGSGTIIYNSTIVSITPNTSVTMSRPMAGGSAQTLSFRQLGTYKAILKGFTVSG
jgi:surface protein